MECINGVPAMNGSFSQLLSGVMSTLIASTCLIADPGQWPPDKAGLFLNSEYVQEYDFVVIGAGSAGSTVASRLSEISKWKVLLLEAGGDPTVDNFVPALFFANLKTQGDWQFETEQDEKSCLGMKDQKCLWPRGKVLGGTSAINAMIYMRGNRKDYDDWEKSGNEGWGYDDVLPYFKKSEKLEAREIKDLRDHEMYHGNNGLLNVGTYNNSYVFCETYLRAFKEAGFPLTDDFNGKRQIGFGRSQGTVKDGKRHSAASAYLQPAKDRENLHLVRNAHVTKILIDENTKVATGVEFRLGDNDIKVTVNKEVILSAGTVGSPHLLMVSGIGPKEQLEKFDIKVLQDLPVGENLQDHLMTPVFFQFDKRDQVEDINQEIIKYAMNRQTSLSSPSTYHIIGFLNTLDKELSYPDIQYHFGFSLADMEDPTDFVNKNGYNDEFIKIYRQFNKNKDFAHIFVVLLKPESKGRILLRSKCPFDKPVIHTNYLHADGDMATVLRGIKELYKLEDTDTFKQINGKMTKVDFGPCGKKEFKSDEYWECIVSQYASTIYHPTGTVKMGTSNDATAVVDSKLRVYGIKSLRVADASIMPQIVSGNTNAPTIMIGEKVADMIKEEWSEKTAHMEL